MKQNKYSIIVYRGSDSIYFTVETIKKKVIVYFRIEHECRRNTLVEVAQLTATECSAWIQYPKTKRWFFTRHGVQCALTLRSYFSSNKSIGFYEKIANLIENKEVYKIFDEIFSSAED